MSCGGVPPAFASMSLIGRLSLVLGSVLIALAIALWIGKAENEGHLQNLREERRNERAEFLARAVQLQGTGLEALVSSYSWWQDMVKFVATPDLKWAADTVDNIVGIPGGGDALWVLSTDWQLVHSIDSDFGRPPVPFPDAAALSAWIKHRYQFNFFTVIDGAIWQVFGAAIQDPNFWRHETPVRGYLLLGKRWDDTWIARLSSLSQAKLRLHLGEARGEHPSRQFVHSIEGLDGRPIASVIGTVEAGATEDVSNVLRRQVLLTVIGLFLLVAAMVALLALQVIRPLDRILRSLESRNPLPIADLLPARNQVGQIARLLASQFRQGQMLQSELRRHLELAKPAPDDGESLRLRLASDLHDGPLQSLYAAGLKIGALEQRLAAGQSVSPAELVAIRAILSECSVNLRNLLFDLEPEGLRDHELETALERLERYMRSIQSEFELVIGEQALDGLAREPQLHLFYICRELVSNATRHARPTRAWLRIKRQEEFLTLEWFNDGVLPSPQTAQPGNGLRNIDQRVKRLDGTWRHQLHHGREWSVTIELPYTSLVAPIMLGALGADQ